MSAPPNPSFWLETTPETDYPPLEDDLSVDVAVLGAGITGLTAAALLSNQAALERVARFVEVRDRRRGSAREPGAGTADATDLVTQEKGTSIKAPR